MNHQEEKEWRKSLKVGDEIVPNKYNLIGKASITKHSVERVTATRISIKDNDSGHVVTYNIKTGEEVGGGDKSLDYFSNETIQTVLRYNALKDARVKDARDFLKYQVCNLSDKVEDEHVVSLTMKIKELIREHSKQ